MKLENVQALCSLARTAVGETMFGRLCVKDGKGQIMLAEGAAEAPVEISGSFVVDPAKFGSACAAAGPQAEVKVNEKSVTVKGNGFRFNVRTMPADDYPWQDMTGGATSKVILGNLTAGIAAALPFGGDSPIQPHLYGVTLKAGFVYAANGPCGIRVPAAKLDMQVDLSPGAAKLISWRGDEPTDYCQPSATAYTFFYADGAALRLNKLDTVRPAALFSMLDELPATGLQPVPTGLVEAITTVAGFAQGKNRWLRLNAEGITFKTEDGEANYHAGGLPEAAVNAEQLIPMLKMSEQWAIDGDGKPLRFWKGDGLRGLVTQVRI